MNTTDKKIADILAKYGEAFASSVWRVQGTAVIYHKALERIAAQAKITFDEPTIIRAERDEAVIRVTGRMGNRVEWSIGEALIGVNYRVSGKQAAYVFAMAEKRAKDRVILKLIELSGDVYSEEEADEFKDAAPRQDRQTAQDNQPTTTGSPSKGLADEMIAAIGSRPTVAHLSRLLDSAAYKNDFAALSEDDKQRVIEAETKRRGELEAA